MSELAFRPYDASTDEGMVYKSWLYNFRGAHHAGVLPRPIYYAAYRETIGYLLQRGAEIVIACAPGVDQSVDAYGWICHERGFDRPVVHFMNVKEDYRGKGIEKKLLEQAGATGVYYFTFRLPSSAQSMPGGVHRPEIVWFEKPRAIEKLQSRHARDEHRAQRDGYSREGDRLRDARRKEARDNLEETE